jgi:argininosuccinate lyase
MSGYVWQTAGTDDPDQAVMEFLAGEDITLDAVLFPYDIRATRAHVRGLQRIGILSEEECEQICEALDQLISDFDSGAFKLDGRFEDGHSAIEHFVTNSTGEAGAKLHTGRSRNDQVLVASRLFLKDTLSRLIGLEKAIAIACLDRAEADANLPMPGYTHLQRAVPSSVGMWLGGIAESLADSIDFARSVAEVIDCNPLGTAAGYGVNLPLDREGVTEELEFERLQVNPVASQGSRGKFEVMALQAASHGLHDVVRLAWDLSLFTSAEFGFVSLPSRYTTGSSIMPNKRNPDVVELLRARPAVVDAAIQEIQQIIALPSGYHRDLQYTKPPMIRGLSAALQALAVVPGIVSGMKFNAECMKEAISPDMFATDKAIESAVNGVPFRSAYRQVKEGAGEEQSSTAEESLARRVSPGASGDLRLDVIRRRLVGE